MEPEVKRALLVEPDFLHADAAAANLEAAGFDVTHRAGADEAYLLLLDQQARFDIAVVTFPYQVDRRPDTVQLLEHLRELSMPRVVVSSLNRGSLDAAYPLQNGEGYIEIPFRWDAIEKAVEEVLGKR